MFFGRTDAEAETPVQRPPDAKNWLIWKDPASGKDWRWEEKGKTEDEMVGWMALPAQWTCVWVNSGSWWWTGRPGMLQSMGSQRVGHEWATELNWTDVFAVQGTLKNLLQHHNSKASILQPSTFFVVEFSHLYMTTGKTIALTVWVFVSKAMSLLLFHILSRPLLMLNMQHTNTKKLKFLVLSWRIQNFPASVLISFKFFESVFALQCCVSTVQQSESAIRMCLSPVFWISFPFRSPLSKASVLYSRFSLVFCFIHSSVYISVWISQYPAFVLIDNL